MSTLTRILIMAFSWLAFFLVTFYGCIKPTYAALPTVSTEPAPTSSEEVVTPDPEPESSTLLVEDLPLLTTFDRADITPGPAWDDLRAQLIERYTEDPRQQLIVMGNYYPQEAVPAGSENVGEARARLIGELLQPAIPADRMVFRSYALDGERPAGNDRWLAGSFDWSNVTDAVGAELIQLSEREIVIRFPFNEASSSISTEVDAYLGRLATRLQQTEERITIVGHTDNVDTEAFNRRLGQQRADFVKQILVKNGAPAAQITTSSEGETQPEASNETAEGRRKNRRAVVRLIG